MGLRVIKKCHFLDRWISLSGLYTLDVSEKIGRLDRFFSVDPTVFLSIFLPCFLMNFMYIRLLTHID